MFYSKEQVMARSNVVALANFLVLGATAAVLPFFIHVQWLTGPIVNAILIISLFLVGIRAALLLCLIPSLMALSGGLLPAVLAPVVPFIMIGNVILVLSVDYFSSRFRKAESGFFLGVIFGAAVKYLWLFFNTGLMMNLVLKQELAVKVAQMMSWPQLATALLGGVIAFMALKWLKRM